MDTVDLQTLEYLDSLAKIVAQTEDWKLTLDTLIASLRKHFVFDNIAIYILDYEARTRSIEVAYARALGRGHKAEADAAWGEVMAGQVLTSNQISVQEPINVEHIEKRLGHPYLLGLPLNTPTELIGALVFVRFGGPPYSQEQIHLASLVTMMISHAFERRIWKEKLKNLETLQSQLRMQEDFVATISHELRTPLGFIKGYSTTLLRQDTVWDENTRREFLMIIEEESDRLNELIESVLESARLQSDTLQMNIQPVRLDAIIRDVTTRVSARHKSVEVDLSCIQCTPILGDNVRLALVFENLFSNAIKYAPDTKITINIQRIGDFMRITFSDQGPGITGEHLPYIFDRFYRVPGQPGRTGTGLGLFICKQIVTAHHGNIWAESMPGKGTTFIIDLPA
jgi:signal transduction histidine kinase